MTAEMIDTEHRYPWVEGFDAVFDEIWQQPSGKPASKERILGQVGIFWCGDGICDGVCSNSLAEIREERGYAWGGDDQYSYIKGARAAIRAMTVTTRIPAQEVTNYV